MSQFLVSFRDDVWNIAGTDCDKLQGLRAFHTNLILGLTTRPPKLGDEAITSFCDVYRNVARARIASEYTQRWITLMEARSWN
jgi:hypothetical protein